MRVLGIVGKILIGAGVTLLLFAAYQIWGTSFQEGHTQNVLRNTLQQEAQNAAVRHALAEAAALDKLPTGPPRIAPTSKAPAEGQPVGVIRIPTIGINQVLVEGTNTNDLRKGPGHYIGTPLPGQAGNSGVAGHRTTYGHPFYNLDALKPGDDIVVTTVQGIFVYDTIRSQVVSPSDSAVLDNAFGAYITLTTCNPRFSASSRLVVTGKLAHSQLFPNSGLPTQLASNSPQSGDLAGTTGGLGSAIVWGVIVAAVVAIDLLLAHRFRPRRWMIWAPGIVVVLVLLYNFFGAISPLLPASF
ncbi:MAG TPA: class E sortase [Acidimicrobiales bacterium]|nr:class E sortase [Acidimicrobiales bacterium]